MRILLRNVARTFPPGTSVSAYAAPNKSLRDTVLGTVVDTASVASDGSLTFTAVNPGTKYIAFASVSGSNKYVRFRTEEQARVTIAATTSGDATVVAAVPGKRIRVVGYALVAGAAVTVKWKSGANDITGSMALAANGGVSHPGDGAEPLETRPGEALILNLSAIATVGGHLTYELV